MVKELIPMIISLIYRVGDPKIWLLHIYIRKDVEDRMTSDIKKFTNNLDV